MAVLVPASLRLRSLLAFAAPYVQLGGRSVATSAEDWRVYPAPLKPALPAAALDRSLAELALPFGAVLDLQPVTAPAAAARTAAVAAGETLMLRCELQAQKEAFNLLASARASTTPTAVGEAVSVVARRQYAQLMRLYAGAGVADPEPDSASYSSNSGGEAAAEQPVAVSEVLLDLFPLPPAVAAGLDAAAEELLSSVAACASGFAPPLCVRCPKQKAVSSSPCACPSSNGSGQSDEYDIMEYIFETHPNQVAGANAHCDRCVNGRRPTALLISTAPEPSPVSASTLAQTTMTQTQAAAQGSPPALRTGAS